MLQAILETRHLRKLYIKSFTLVCSVLFLSSHAWAISLSFSPSTSEIGIGDSIDIDLIISGMENDDLGYFEFDVNYDDFILDFFHCDLHGSMGLMRIYTL